ncbi:MAG: NAD(+)/NADH kinase [Oscillospiraceae bacterium]|nr:NAD(+)/NADH kinase [Oscillospiraceae bacterium]
MKALLLPNFQKKDCLEIIQSIIVALQKDSVEVYVLEDIRDKITDSSVKSISSDKLYGNIDFAVTIGGDGTIIRAAYLLLEFEIPIIGVNLGTLGFLTGIEKDELNLLHKIAQGKYSIEERLVLKVDIENKDGKTSFNAINDVIICKNAFSGIIDIDVNCGGIETAHYRADGIILSTASGSTAYAMSAGGPIMHPSVKAISLTPICAHSLLSRTIILPENETVTVKTNANLDKKTACVVADGLCSQQITENDKITINRYHKNVKFICLEGKNYYSAINQKLMER